MSAERFIFAVQGPRSLLALQRAAAEDLRDIRFNHSRLSSIAGVEVRLLRTGISGELGYEIHGRADGASAVWTAILDAGADVGIQQLGFRSQPVQHIETGIATNGLDYLPASAMHIGPPRQFRQGRITGSFVPGAFSDYFRRPDELGWGGRGADPDHEFLGRDALLRAREGEQRTLVGLRWSTEDVLEVFASMFDETPAEQMDVPRRAGPAFDRVLSGPGGEDVGVSTGRTISLGLRATISLAVLDQPSAAPGTELTVVSGSPDSAQRMIRATTVTLPFKADNRRVDVAALAEPDRS